MFYAKRFYCQVTIIYLTVVHIPSHRAHSYDYILISDTANLWLLIKNNPILGFGLLDITYL